jgi:HK97 family phage prohead protease
MSPMPETRPPRENLFRGPRPFEYRLEPCANRAAPATDGELAGDGHMVGHFAVFNQWTEINSMWEGNFLERFVPGAFKKTIKDNPGMRVLFQHGRDAQIGDKPLGPIEALAEDDYGTAYDVRLLDTSYNRDLIPGLEADLYGASFRFNVMREDWVNEPKASEYNPGGLPERTVREAAVAEFGPVTFPAYGGATAGLRSLTDEILVRMYARDPERVRQMLGLVPSPQTPDTDSGGGEPDPVAPPDDAGQPPTSQGRRDEPKPLRPLEIIRNVKREKEHV